MHLEELGWNSYFASHYVNGTPGRVALATRKHFVVWTEEGEVEATASGRLRHLNTLCPCVGDWVLLRGQSVIESVLPRRTELLRKSPGKGVREQVLAANVDVLLVVAGLDGDYNPRRIERYLVLARDSGARPVLLLNKADLRGDVTNVIRAAGQFAPGVPVLAISALAGWGLDELPKRVGWGETAALIGSSGAGKSTILNRFLGEDRQRTASVRERDSRGRHTTTHRELVRMPEGWFLMDLPGLRELQLWADPEQIDDTFSDIVGLAAGCRFRDCSHQHEPGCAVRAAAIDEGRLQSYYKLKRELAYLDRDIDVRLARETKRRCKIIEREMRHHSP